MDPAEAYRLRKRADGRNHPCRRKTTGDAHRPLSCRPMSTQSGENTMPGDPEPGSVPTGSDEAAALREGVLTLD
jgi:hypothetical protein